MTISHEQALKHWLDNNDEHRPSIEEAQHEHDVAEQNNFSTVGIPRWDYAVKQGYVTREEADLSLKSELKKYLHYAQTWGQPDNWELETLTTILTTEQLNNYKNFGEWDCVPEHAEEEGYCHENPDWDWRTSGAAGHQYWILDKPFTVRVFYRKNSDYFIAIIFTDVNDTQILAISDRED